MPFWWRRRRRYYRPWNKRWRRFNRRKKRTRIRRRRRARRFNRRRRKRRHFKVKRKRKLITVKQWQPDSIVTCKIKGVDVLVLGAEGKQFVCYTNVRQSTPPPKAPGGGGFGCMQYSLGYLYEQYKFRNNIWTKTNIARDLCRFVRVKFTFYRHQDTDFIIRYDRQPPFDIEPLTYPLCHPQNLLLGRHKIILLSKSTKPNGKIKKTKVIKPPKQMLTKWFFQHQFAAAPLLQLTASAASFKYAHIGCCNKNAIVTFPALNPTFYRNGNWAQYQAETKPYLPWIGTPSQLYFWDTVEWPWPKPDEKQQEQKAWIQKHSVKIHPLSYTESVGYKTGYFNSKVLQSVLVTRDLDINSRQAVTPTIIARYNPAKDTGKGNTIWLHSNLTASYEKPSTDKTVIIQGLPIWMALYGWLSYVQHVKGAPDFYISYTCCIESPAIDVSASIGATNTIIPIDNTFMQGKPPYGQDLSTFDVTHWYPDIYNQAETLNALVTVGPYVPKLNQDRNSTWELHAFYEFLFKWGGPEITEPQVADPSTQPVYDAFDKQPSSVQIRNPFHQKYETIIHPWDYRRGILKSSALKRIQDNMSTESSFQEDEPVPKRHRIVGPCLSVPEKENQDIKACLQELCKESTSQEAQEETNLIQLIQQQKQQQQDIKYNLLRLISELKEQQQQLKLQAGLI
nr:MAG: ORF1 [Torque teno midi virus]